MRLSINVLSRIKMDLVGPEVTWKRQATSTGLSHVPMFGMGRDKEMEGEEGTEG